MKISFGMVACSFIAVFLFVAGCEKLQTETSTGQEAQSKVQTTNDEQAPPSGPNTPPAIPLPFGPGTVPTVTVGTTQFSVEIAETAADREHGLKGRESLADNAGMLFIFPQTGQEKFWMQNSKIPLDIIFIDETTGEGGISKPGKVVSIIENTVPESTELLLSPIPYRYALEVKGGSAAKFGIKIGDPVEKRIGPR